MSDPTTPDQAALRAAKTINGEHEAFGFMTNNEIAEIIAAEYREAVEALRLMVNGHRCDDHCEEVHDAGKKCIHDIARAVLARLEGKS